MKDQICKNCVHFHQHYVLDSHRATAINDGHCSYPRLKSRKPNKPACEHFALPTTPADLPNRKEVIDYLTKDTLRHILELVLPPEIVEGK